MKRALVVLGVVLIASSGLAACGKKARLRTPTDERERQEREASEDKIESYSDERYRENAEDLDAPPAPDEDGPR